MLTTVRNQSYKTLEIILVDDGSPDSCGVICDEIARTDYRVRVIHKKMVGCQVQEMQAWMLLKEIILLL